jgi:DNA-directed RNA polymerase specialized sigma subunit
MIDIPIDKEDVNLINDFNKTNDLEFFNRWKTTGSKEDLGKLVSQFEPLMFKQVKRQAGSIPQSALSSEAKKQTIIAMERYDPSTGAALSTLLFNRLNKLKRLNSKYQNAVRLPENQHYTFTEFNNSVERLKESLNREPNEMELASDLGWAKKEVKRMKDRLYSDLYESGTDVATPFTKFDNTKILKGLVEENLDPQEKIIWDNVQLSKEKQKSVPELAQAMGININRYQYVKGKMVTKIRRLQNDLGTFE